MKNKMFIGVLLSLGMFTDAIADCEKSTMVSVNVLRTLLPGNTVCAVKDNGDKWQEYHDRSGKLFDFKKGPNDPVDPSKELGTWEVSRRGGICYRYGGDNFNYCYSIHKVPNQELYQFCNTKGLDVTASIRPGNIGCGFK